MTSIYRILLIRSACGRILIVFVFLVPASLIMRRKIESDNPSFILNKLEELKFNTVLMDSIGGFRLYEYTYNERDSENGDTVRYSIKMTGYTGKLLYRGVEVKPSSKPWELVSDTLVVNSW